MSRVCPVCSSGLSTAFSAPRRASGWWQVLTSFDPESGKVLKRGRLRGALGAYFASPVASDGKIYAVSEEGKVAVIRAGAEWVLLAVNAMDEGSKSTIAIVDSKLYVRTYDALYSFAEAN